MGRRAPGPSRPDPHSSAPPPTLPSPRLFPSANFRRNFAKAPERELLGGPSLDEGGPGERTPQGPAPATSRECLPKERPRDATGGDAAPAVDLGAGNPCHS